MNINDISLRPIITEKSTSDAARGYFTFKVAKKANKEMIKRAIEEKFKVDVELVSTSIMKGKKKRVGARRKEVLDSAWKKAVVRLASGQKIDLFEVGA